MTARTALAACLLLACASEPRDAASVAVSLDVGELLGGADTLHERAVETRSFSFPADHGPHPTFRTEWWYYTGNLTADDGREFGYQLTFFRSALTDSASYPRDAERSDWRSRHAYMAHFAVSDIGAARIHAAQRFGRAALGLAGANATPFRVWLYDWQVAGGGGADGKFPVRLAAEDADFAIDLVLDRGAPMVLQGEGGLSRKGPEPGNASYYYSYMRMPSAGTVRIGDRTHRVRGESWLDREWSTSALSPDLEGWDWMALQFTDSTEMMLYRLRRHDGTAGPFSAGSFVDRDGRVLRLDADMFDMTPRRSWPSTLDGTRYPVGWRVRVPGLHLDLQVDAAFDAQELNLAVRYWEGAVRIQGSRAGMPVGGRGYLEMTGYDAAVREAGRTPR
jgi:predicted secreted hydrolase